jgi:hypothetical protein
MHSDDINIAPVSAEASREGSHDDDSEPSRRVISEDLLLLKPMPDLGEGREVHIRRHELSLPSDMSFDSWRKLGSNFILIANCSAWWIGDWLVYGEQAYGDRYQHAINDTSLGYQTLRNYAWVAKKFPPSRRRDTLSFGHHAEVSALPDDEQDAWLAWAEELNWSRNQLRQRLRANRQAASGERSVCTRPLKIDVPAERHDLWRSAAERKKCSVTDWVISTLDRAASED